MPLSFSEFSEFSNEFTFTNIKLNNKIENKNKIKFNLNII